MSPRHWLRRHLKPPKGLLESRATRWLGHRLHDPELWHLGRRAVAGGVALGFFLAFVPLPVQMALAAPLALLLRVNLPVAMAGVWLTNPVTGGPMFLFAYKVGEWLTGEGGHFAGFEPSLDNLLALIDEIWWPLAVGCTVCGVVAAVIGYLAVRGLWRLYLVRRLHAQRARRAAAPPRRPPLPGP